MKISIITICQNSEKTIRDTIESVLSQNYPSIEYIVVDGGSTDYTLELVKEHEPRFNGALKWISESDKGIYDALNKGISLASGDIIGILHSDDLFASESILEQIAFEFSKTPRVSGIYGDLKYVNKTNTKSVIRFWKSKPFKTKNLKYGWMPAHPTLFLKKEVYQKHGNYDSNFKIAADYDFMLRILNDQMLQFKYLPVVITYMRVGGNSNKSLINLFIKSKEDLKAIRKNKAGGLYTLVFKNLRKTGQFFN
jgi:glycosyltransferase involved in cell wall biosynthesis